MKKLVLLILSICSLTLFSQEFKQVSPQSKSFALSSVQQIHTVDVSSINWTLLHKEDSIALANNLPIRAGVSLSHEIDPATDGEWTLLPNNKVVWPCKITVPGATSIVISFDKWKLSDDAELFVYNDNGYVVGAYTANHNDKNGGIRQMATTPVPGEIITIELVENAKPNTLPLPPKSKNETQGNIAIQQYTGRVGPVELQNYTPKSILHISEIALIYNDPINEIPLKDLGDADVCQVNINCSPEGDNWQAQKRGVARIFFREGASWYLCSGSLVNNTQNNGIPYFLTAYHCGGDASAADRNVWQFYFNYERPGCPNTGTPPNNVITGCTYKAGGDITGGSDFQLVELYDDPPLSWSPYFNGWSRSVTASSSGVGIHHPSGDAKKISTYTTTLGTGTWSGGISSGHWTVRWAATTNGWGVTEGGSSGSPLFDNNKRIIGTLTGGSSTCSNPTAMDLYGKFPVHWTANGTTADKQLKPWLDPLDSDPTTLDGFDPNASTDPPIANFSGTPTTITAGQSVQFTDISSNYPTSWKWTFSGGYPSTSTIRNPIITYFTPGTYEVKLVVYNQYGSDSITKVNYITVNSYSPPSSPITIGTGTSQGGVYPLGINTRPQGQAKFVNDASIYLSSEIGGSCIINAIAWRPNTSRTDTRNIKIYMKHTDLTSFTACTTDDLIADATLVYDGTFTPDVVGWFTINLQNPFKYISGKNLMVITKVNSTATNLNAPSNCYYTTSPSRHQQWNGTTDPSANNGTVNNNRPNIQLTVQGYTAPTANFVGLNSVFSEDFESTTFPPTNWIIVDGDGNGNKWNHTTAQNHTLNGSRSAYHGWGDGLTYEKGWLITPAIVLPSGSPKLSFWSYNSYPTYYGDNTVLISTTTSDTSSFTPLWQPASVTEPWSQTIIDLTYYAGQTVYIAFRYRGTDAHGWYLDDVMIQQEVSDTLRTYEGDPVYFIDKSTNVPIAWDWTLQGAVDNHLYVQNPTTIYNVAGLYDVSLKAANPAGENVKNKNDFVKVIGRAPISRLEGKGNLKDYYLRPFIPIGGTVNFTDKSLRVPTGWNWTFDGGVPNTSTAQNPTNIRYSSPGLYNVTLNTYNAHGADTVTYLEYVVVGGIDTCTNFVSSDALAVYSATNGLIPGHCDFGSSDRLYRYAEYYTNSYPGKIHGFGMYVVEAQGTGKTIKVTVWDDDGGFPGSVIYTETRDITSFTAGAYNEIIFSSPVSVTGNFFIGYELNYDANHNYTTHQFCGAMATFRTSTVAPTAFASYGTTSPGTWYNFKDIFEDESSLYLDLIFEYISTGPTVIATALPDAICNSESSVLTASGADTYSWSHGLGSGSSKTVTPSTTTTYTVTGTVGGNTETATVTVTVNPLPTVTVSADPTTICEGATSVLTAGGASTYTWSHSLGSVSSITVTPSSTTTYTVTGTSAAGCTNTATVTVTVNSIPTVTASASPTSICEGESSILTAGGASTYTWSHSLGSGSSKTVIPSITTTYTVTGTNAAGCSNTAIVTVTVNSLPTVTASADPITICEGATSTLTAGGASTYSWSHSLGSGSSITVTPSSTTTYTVTGTSAAGCTNTTSVTVTVNSIPTVTASATPTSVCYGESSTLTASGASTYTWSHSLGSGSSKTVIPASTTTYTVTGTTAGCSNTAAVTVTVNSIPTVTASAAPTSICEGATSVLTAGGASTYTWSHSLGSGSSITVTPSSTTTYTVTGTSAGCSNTATVTVIVNSIPIVTASATPTSVCYGESSILTAGGASTYTWSHSLGSGSSKTVIPASTTTYTVTGTTAGCSNTATVTVTVNSIPTVTASASPTSVCAGASSTLTAGGASTYTWSHSLGSGSSITVTPSSTTTYTVTGTTAGCSNTATVTVTVNSIPTVTASASPTSVCAGASSKLTAGGASTYNWSHSLGSGSSITVTPSTTTTYTVTGTTAGCSNTATVKVTVNPLPTVTASASPTSVCYGESSILTAGGASTYNWSHSLGAGSSITVIPASTTTYTVTGTTTGCSNTATVTVTVNSIPTVTASASPTSICEGATSTLSAGGANTYTWSHSLGSGSSITLTPSSTTTYTVTGTSTAGCTNTASVTVTVNFIPTITASADPTSICEGETSTLSADGASTYTWSHSLGSGSSKTVTPSSTTIYSVTGTSAAGCTNTTSVTVTVNSIPTVTASATPTSVCAGASSTLTAGGASTYTWSHSLGAGSSITVTPSSTTTYTVTGTSAAGCTNTTSVTVTVNSIPTVTASADPTSICEGETSILSADGASTYNWSHSLGSGSSITVTPSSTTTYSVTGTSAAGCTNTTSVTVTVNSIPTVTASATPTSVCYGESSTLTAGGASTYNWSHSLGAGSSITVTPSSTTTYTVTGTSAAGCTNTATVTVTVNSIPTVTASASPTSICEGATSTLSAGGANTYTWSHSLGSGSSITLTPSSTTTYTVTGTSTAGCTNTASVTVTVNFIPTITASADPTSICEGETSILSADGASTYNWSHSLGSGSSITVTPSSTTTYSVTGTSAAGCTNTTSVTVTVNSIPTVTASADPTSICEGETSTLSADGASTYNWSHSLGSGSSITVTPSSTTTYTVTGTSAAGCTNTASVTVTVNSIPTITASADPTSICEGETSTLSADGASTYTWSHSLGSGSSKTVTPSSTTTYTVTGTSAAGCTNTASVTITVNSIPTVTASASPITICAGLPSTLTASGASTYNWSIGETGSSITVTPSYTTTYTVTGTSTANCSATATVTVNVNPLPLTPTYTIDCTGGENLGIITVTSPLGSDYEYSVGGPYQSDPQFDSLANGTYTITVRNINTSCITSTSPINLNCACSDPPTLTLSSTSGNTCFYTPYTVNGNTFGGSATQVTLLHNGDGNLNNTTFTSSPFNFTYTPAPTDAGHNVTITITTNNPLGSPCVPSEAIFVLTVNPSPTITASADPTSICEGETSILSAGGASTYTWSHSLGAGSSKTVTPSTTTTYTVTGTSAASCTNTASVSVTVDPATIAGTLSGGSTEVCVGSNSGIMTLSGYTGNIIRWEKRINGGAWINIANTTDTYNEDLTIEGIYEFRVLVQSGVCDSAYSNTLSITVNPATIAGTLSGGSTEVCVGSNSGIMTLSGYTGNIIRWEKRINGGAWINIANTTDTYNEDLTIEGIYEFRVLVQSGVCDSAYSNTLSITVNPATIAGTLSGGSTEVCVGSNSGIMTLSGYTGNIIRWEKRINGGAWINIANTTDTYNEDLTIEGIYEFRVLVQSGVCDSAYSNTLSITVNPATIAGTLSGGSTEVCVGSNSGIMTLSGYTGNIIRWEKRINGGAWINIANTTDTYNEDLTIEGIYEFRVLVQSGVCDSAYSNTLSITVNPATIAGTLSGGSTEVCVGSNSGIMTLSGYTGNIIRWEKRINGGAWINIANTTDTYNEDLTIEGTYEFRVLVQSGVCASAYSDTLSITVNPATIAGTLSGGNSEVCVGSNSGIMTLSGYTGNIIRWEKRINGGAWINIANTTDTYNEDLTIEGIYEFRVLVQSGVCDSAYSNTLSITVNPATIAGTLSGGSTEVCVGSNSGIMTLSGYTGNIIRWEKRINGGAWINIANTIDTYNEDLTIEGTYEFRVLVQSGVCASAYSDTLSITVNPATIAGTLSGGSTEVCVGSNSGIMTLSGYTGNIIRWEKRINGGAWINIANTTDTYNEDLTIEGTYEFRVLVQSGVCASAYSNTLSITVNPATIAGTLSGGNSEVCVGSNSGIMTLSGYTGNIIRWEKRINGGAWINIANTTDTYNEDLTIEGIYEFRVLVQSGVCDSAYSDTLSITVNPATIAGTLSGGSTEVCVGSNSGIMTLSGYTGNIIRWEKRINGGAWINIANTTDTYNEDLTIEGTYEFRVLVQSGVCMQEYSSILEISVYDIPEAGILNGDDTSICANSSTGIMTLSGYNGTIIKWQSRYNGGSWTDIINTTNTYEEIITQTGLWEYRVIVGNGACEPDTSNIFSINVTEPTIPGVLNGSGEYCGIANPVLNLIGYVGTIINWEEKFNNNNWTIINNTTDNYQPILTDAGTYKYRVKVANGNCPEAYSNEVIVQVYDSTYAGMLVYPSDSICFGESTGLITVIGYVGDIIKWQYSIDAGSWVDIPYTGEQYQYTPTSPGIWQFRIVVKNGTCDIEYSDPAIIDVLPTPVASFNHIIDSNIVAFINTSQFANTYYWLFGDGQSSNEVNPEHSYLHDGTYEVTLIASNGVCSDTTKDNVTIMFESIAEFSSGNYVAIYPNPSADGNVILSFTDNSIQTISLRISNQLGDIINIYENIEIINSKLSLDLSYLNSSVYFIEVIANQERVILPLMIIR